MQKIQLTCEQVAKALGIENGFLTKVSESIEGSKRIYSFEVYERK